MTAAEPLIERLAGDFLQHHPVPAARALERLELTAQLEALEFATAPAVATLLSFADGRAGSLVLGKLAEERLRNVVDALDPAQAAKIITWLDDKERASLLGRLSETQAAPIKDALEYPPATAGRMMYTRVIPLRASMRVGEAFDSIRRTTIRSITDLVVTDDDGKYSGLVSLQTAALADPDDDLGSLARRDAPSVHPMSSREEVVELLDKYRLSSLPVVDLDGRVVGILRHDSLVRAAEQEALADVQAMVGVSKEERALASPFQAVKSRLPWLNINLLTAFLAAGVVGLFDRTIERFTMLAVLLPIVAGQSGNTGAQALAVTMRGLALREVRGNHLWRLVRKELVAGSINGLSIGVVTSAGVYLWTFNPGLTLIMGVSMVLAMAISGAAGVTVPMLLRALGRDPAVASSILLTTVTDVSGFFIFLGLATVLSSLL